MLAIYLFHYARADGSPWATDPVLLEQHLSTLGSCGQTVHSGESASAGKSICLSFDDASYCFYHYVYPVLKKHNLKAILAVAAFCTWQELREMQESGLVEIASHTCTHPNLNRCSVEELDRECRESSQAITKHVGKQPPVLVLPFGRGTSKVIAHASRQYRYVLRIGDAWNHSWNDRSPLYRVPSDQLPADKLLPPGKYAGWLNHYWNRLRNR
jgi:peptidoglycan/xylan/chitin deacetylase (PgdA/CDA1 family)